MRKINGVISHRLPCFQSCRRRDAVSRQKVGISLSLRGSERSRHQGSMKTTQVRCSGLEDSGFCKITVSVILDVRGLREDPPRLRCCTLSYSGRLLDFFERHAGFPGDCFTPRVRYQLVQEGEICVGESDGERCEGSTICARLCRVYLNTSYIRSTVVQHHHPFCLSKLGLGSEMKRTPRVVPTCSPTSASPPR